MSLPMVHEKRLKTMGFGEMTCFRSLDWDIVGLPQGSKRLLPEKIRKGVPGPLGLESGKARKRVENEPKTRKKKTKK